MIYISEERKKKKESNPLDRVLKVIAFSKPDRVPIIFFPEWDFLADFLGISVKKLLSNVDLQINANEKFKTRFPGAYGAVSIYQPYASAQAFGCKVSDQENEIPAVVAPIITQPEDVFSLKVPIPWEAPGTRDWLLKIEYGIEKGVPVAGIGEFGPFELAGQLYGYDRMILHMRRRPEVIHALLEKTTQFMIDFFMTWAKKLPTGRATITLIADHVSGFMNNQLIDEFFGPYHKKITQALKPISAVMLYHSENRSGHIISKIGSWGYQMFHGQDWAVDGDLRKTKEVVTNSANRYVLMGQVPGRDVVLREPSDEIVKQKIIENILMYAPGGGYVLSTGGGINRGTPLKRLDMMIELADKYGRYKSKKELYGPDET